MTTAAKKKEIDGRKNRPMKTTSMTTFFSKLELGQKYLQSTIVEGETMDRNALSVATRSLRNRISPVLLRVAGFPHFAHMKFETHTAQSIATNGDVIVTVIVERTA